MGWTSAARAGDACTGEQRLRAQSEHLIERAFKTDQPRCDQLTARAPKRSRRQSKQPTKPLFAVKTKPLRVCGAGSAKVEAERLRAAALEVALAQKAVIDPPEALRQS